MRLIKKGSYALAVLLLAVAMFSCEKENRKIDINDGNENPSVRKLFIEMSHRYSFTRDSLLPGVAITLYDNEDDLQLNRYTRSDTTGPDGMVVFQQMNAGDYIVILNHKMLGTKREQLNITNETVASYEYFYF